MARITEVYAGRYIRAAELGPKRRQAVIAAAEVTDIGQGDNVSQQVALSLETRAGTAYPRQLILNKTNANLLAAAFGDETDRWPGHTIELWAEPVMYQGNLVPGKKVMPLSSQGPATAAPSRAGGIPDGTAVPAEQPGIEEPTREGKPSPSAMYAVGGIPPAAPRERKPRDAYARAGAKPTGKPRAATEDDLDDEIPY